MEPRECRGNEPQLDKCELRLSGDPNLWQCMDNEHFNYIHCGSNVSLSKDYIGNWGSITFAIPYLEYQTDRDSIQGFLKFNNFLKKAYLLIIKVNNDQIFE